MGSYIPSTVGERREMLAKLGLTNADELFSQIPAEARAGTLKLPQGKSELGVKREMEQLASENKKYGVIFRGAGSYNHYIPSIVKSVTAKEEFLTAYTPYQAEISQGVLQSIFEYQTMICALTGMDVSNASVYDGATASAEALLMFRDRRRSKLLISGTVNPFVLKTVKTYCFGANAELAVVPVKNGVTDKDALASMLDSETAAFLVQTPNFYGLTEDATELGEAVHAAGAKFVMNINPIAAAVLKTPAECGADAAVGEGQPLGMPMSFGGPYLGFMAATKDSMRKLPGRIVGQTTDKEGRRTFVLTLQAREQHIRREKASSNICSNEALCAMTAAVYMTAMGAQGMAQAANQSLANAHYLQKKLAGIKGFEPRFDGFFFNEFMTNSPVPYEKIEAVLDPLGILGGLPVDGGILWCATEMNTKAEIDALVKALSGIGGNV